MTGWRIGADIGRTLTDLVLRNGETDDGALAKRLTALVRPDDAEIWRVTALVRRDPRAVPQRAGRHVNRALCRRASARRIWHQHRAELYGRLHSLRVQMRLWPETPNNDGALRPLVVDAPAGSLLAAEYSAAVCERHRVGHSLPSLVLRVLADAQLDAVFAGGYDALWERHVFGDDDGMGAPYS